MKTLNLIIVAFMFVFCSCNSGTKTNGQKVTFGINETFKIGELPNSFIDSLKMMNIQINSNLQQSIIGYITINDTSILEMEMYPGKFKLVKTYYPVDKDKKYYAIFACVPNSAIDNSHIKRAKVKSNNVEINFKMEGAKKWAELTKKNIGKTVVFIIDNNVYAMPEINSEIRNGQAFINNLDSETIAKSISAALNSSKSN
jgi:SecD/SecF fusion protein